MNRAQVRARIVEIGIIPGIRVSTPELATFAAEAVFRAGIPIAEVTMTTPGGVDVIADLARRHPDMIVGAGTVLDTETARKCLDAGAKFLTSPGLVLEVVELALKNDVVVFPGAFTATEVIAAWKSGADFVKIYSCSSAGGHRHIRTLRQPLPQVPMIASGGVNQQTAADFILAGATAIGIGSELMPREALRSGKEEQIHELARRFRNMVQDARSELAGR